MSLLQEAEKNAQELVAEEERAKRKAEKKKLKKKVGEPWGFGVAAFFWGAASRFFTSGSTWLGAEGGGDCISLLTGACPPFPETKRPKETGETGSREEKQREH